MEELRARLEGYFDSCERERYGAARSGGDPAGREGNPARLPRPLPRQLADGFVQMASTMRASSSACASLWLRVPSSPMP